MKNLLFVVIALCISGCSTLPNTPLYTPLDTPLDRIHMEMHNNFQYEADMTTLTFYNGVWHGNCVAWSKEVYDLASAKGLNPVMMSVVSDVDGVVKRHRVTIVDGDVSSNGKPFTISLEEFITEGNYTPERVYSGGIWYKIVEFNLRNRTSTLVEIGNTR